MDLGSYSSRVTVMMGNAAIVAAEKLKRQIAEAAAEELEVAPDRLVFANGRIAFDARSLSFAEAVVLAEEKFGTLGAVGSYKPPRSPGKYKGAGVGPSPAYSYTACVVEAEVDAKTGWISIPKIWIAHDIGRTINPVLARGQVEGSVYMGLSEALMEEQIFRRLPPKLSSALVHKIPSLLEYKSLTSLDMPELPVRRQGSRPRAAASRDAGGGERHLRRGRRTHRRAADHARQGVARLGIESRRQTGARRP